MLTRSIKRTVSIIGAGRVGTSFAKSLRDAGWRIGVVVTRSAANSRSAVAAIGGGMAQARLTVKALDADVILLTIPDRSLGRVARELAELGRESCKGRVFLHTSGALDHSVLAPVARLGGFTGSLHPMQTFTGHRRPCLQGVIFAVEGDQRARGLAREIIRLLGGVPITIGSSTKPAYHGAGALVAGHALGLVEAARQILIGIGFPRRRALQTLLPLMRQMLDNFERHGGRESWTGPIARGDYLIVAKHMQALGKHSPEFAEAYAALARLSVRVLSKNPGARLRQLERALNNASGGKR